MKAYIGIRQRIYILFVVVAVIPLVAIDFIWLHSSQDQLKHAAIERQSILLSNSAQRLDASISDKIRALTTQSQVQAIINVDVPQAQLSLLEYGIQDPDVKHVSLTDAKGNELINIVNGKISPLRGNLKSTGAFDVVSQISNKAYVGPVTYVDGKPRMTLAVPVLNINKLGDQNLTAGQAEARRFGADIKGDLIVDIDLQPLWSSVLNAKIGSNGYAYLVDQNGKLIAYQNSALITSQANFQTVTEVKKAMAVVAQQTQSASGQVYIPEPAQTTSEKHVQVLSSNYPIAATHWSIIGEEPIDSVFSTVRRVSTIAGTILAISVPLAIILILIATRSIILPLRRLREGVERVGDGELDYQLPVKSKDEIGVLAQTFNKMSNNLAAIVRQVNAESNKVNVILNNVGEGVVAIDESGTILTTNLAAATLIGEVTKTLIGQPFSHFHWMSGGKDFTPSHDEVRVHTNITLITPNKREHFVDILVNPILNDPSGIRTIFTIIDKTNERELENMKVDFVSMAAHELRTPLTAIKGYVELIATDDESKYSEQTTTFIERLKYSSSQSVGLINNLLNVSKIERNALSLNLEKIDWSELMSGAVEDERVSARIKTINLECNLPHEPLYILADRYAISEVVNNLLSNAIKYTQDNGLVTTKVFLHEQKIITEITDSGIGMPEEALQHLFTKFYRAHGGLASGSGGTGLGLYISKSIVEMHQGAITVTSKEGMGSTFTISLPIFDQKRYDELKEKGQIKESKSHGWTTKNIARRR
jgi:signal transduction histidine kinase